ncbi:hypothetical protein FAGKG844_390009 [Frankia sp. AgKG'84/4]
MLRAGADGTVEMANAANGQRYARFTEDAPVRAAAFDALRQSVVTGTDNGLVHLWRALTPATVTNQPAGDQQGEFSATGHLMTGIGADGGLSLWEMTDGHQPEIVASVPSPAHDGLFTPDGATLVTVGSDSATVWSVVDPHHPARLSSIDDPAGRSPGSTTMVPGTSTLAMSTPDGSVTFWDLAQPRRPRRTAIVRIGPPGRPRDLRRRSCSPPPRGAPARVPTHRPADRCLRPRAPDDPGDADRSRRPVREVPPTSRSAGMAASWPPPTGPMPSGCGTSPTRLARWPARSSRPPRSRARSRSPRAGACWPSGVPTAPSICGTCGTPGTSSR